MATPTALERLIDADAPLAQLADEPENHRLIDALLDERARAAQDEVA